MGKKGITVIAMLVLVSTVQAGGIRLGAGAAGGLTIPVAQDDQGQGSAFEIRGIVQVIPSVVLEPNLDFVQYGEPDLSGIISGLDGSKVTGYGVDALLGGVVGRTAIAPYGLVGAGIYKTKRDQTGEDRSDFGWSAGAGLLVGLTSQFGIDVRGRLLVVSSEGGSSKKAAIVTGGLNFYFGN